MKFDHLKDRFMRFALLAVKSTEKFASKKVYWIITDQLIRSSSSAASNYRAASRAKSTRDFINKLKIVEEELDESNFWIEFTIKIDSSFEPAFGPILKEGNELLAIVVASIRTARRNQRTVSKGTD